ncbi:putative ankyrin repeat-containing domain, PGG domain, ankyrin repeat-containing domain superfamily [Helianthus debilis subsp. tardiflorus]
MSSDDYIYFKDYLHEVTTMGDWSKAESMLKSFEDIVTEALTSDGSTVLHIAVGIGHNDFVKKMLFYVTNEQALKQRETDGSTALHVAAIVGNKHAAELLVKKNSKLLRIKDRNGKEPLHKAYENMHLDTIGYLLKAVSDYAETELPSSLSDLANHDDEIGVGLLVNAISAKQYSLAIELMEKFPVFASKRDDVLVAIAKTFPSGLDYWETLVYPSSSDNIVKILFAATSFTLSLLRVPAYALWKFKNEGSSSIKAVVAPIKQIDSKKRDFDGANRLLDIVCCKIDLSENSASDHPYYTRSILEAACKNAYEVVNTILHRSPKAIESTDKDGYDIIHLAILNRSEKIYNLIYDIGERKNLYRTYKDSYKNNILHLVGRLAPSSVLNQRTGAALQLQRELQWREEVKKLVFPTYITQENIFNETPDTVFTREHENLVKEGEKWMKTTAESCSITAALITTIVFAAAITVPGGNNQEKGTPLFRKETAFIIFAISDAISLFASSTALLVFLSILTARFAEKDFLVSLPRRLFIGLFSLLVSTTTMMIAFSATLYLVFGDKKPWMLLPICGLAFIPISSFVTLQFPLMVDLFRSTYLSKFGKQRQIDLFSRFADWVFMEL